MEYIKGITIEEKIPELLKGKTWRDAEASTKKLILDYCLQVVRLAEQLHANGIVFRDLKPGNLMVSYKEKVYGIDFEIAYDLEEQLPDPAYYFGDPSYTAPEQYQRPLPAFTEDIYSLGATFAFMLTGEYPVTIVVPDRTLAKKNLLKLTDEPILTELILQCMDVEAKARPSLSEIASCITTLMDENLYCNKTNPRPQVVAEKPKRVGTIIH